MVKRIAMPGVEQKIITIVAPEVFKRLYDACDERYEGYIQRNRAILCLLIDTGIRVSELCTLTLDCVFFSEDDNFVRVYGKGRKQREVGFGQRTRKALRNYILRYRHASKSEVHVFVSHLDGPLTQSGIDQMLRQLASKAGITMNIHAHLFRHTFAVNYLKAGGDVYKLSRLLGHASVVITEKYLRAFQQRDARQGNISVLDSL